MISNQIQSNFDRLKAASGKIKIYSTRKDVSLPPLQVN
jgi:hypothetical protein